jgi:hypothetical protein
VSFSNFQSYSVYVILTAFSFPTKESWYTKIGFRIYFKLQITVFFERVKIYLRYVKGLFGRDLEKVRVLIRHDFVFCALFL